MVGTSLERPKSHQVVVKDQPLASRYIMPSLAILYTLSQPQVPAYLRSSGIQAGTGWPTPKLTTKERAHRRSGSSERLVVQRYELESSTLPKVWSDLAWLVKDELTKTRHRQNMFSSLLLRIMTDNHSEKLGADFEAEGWDEMDCMHDCDVVRLTPRPLPVLARVQPCNLGYLTCNCIIISESRRGQRNE
jgi:hypothetical protein